MAAAVYSSARHSVRRLYAGLCPAPSCSVASCLFEGAGKGVKKVVGSVHVQTCHRQSVSPQYPPQCPPAPCLAHRLGLGSQVEIDNGLHWCARHHSRQIPCHNGRQVLTLRLEFAYGGRAGERCPVQGHPRWCRSICCWGDLLADQLACPPLRSQMGHIQRDSCSPEGARPPRSQ